MTWLPCDEDQARREWVRWFTEYLINSDRRPVDAFMVADAFVAGARWSASLRGEE